MTANAKPVTVLIPSAGFAAPDLITHLTGHREQPYRVVMTDMNDAIPTRHLGHAFYQSPPTRSETYFDFIVDICKRENVDLILPGKSADAEFFSRNKNELANQGIQVMISEYESMQSVLDKGKSYEVLKGKVPIPDSYEVTTKAGFRDAIRALGYPGKPVCIKPAVYPSESGRGFRILDPSQDAYRRFFFEQPSELYYTNEHQVEEAMDHVVGFPKLLVMEYLPHEEYSVYCFCDKGDAVYIVPNKRLSLYQMSTLEGVVEHNPEVEDICRTICAVFGFDYCINIQLKFSVDRIPKLVEINPRVAGTIMLPIRAGVDMIHFGIMKALGRKYPKQDQIKFGAGIKREFTASYYGV